MGKLSQLWLLLLKSKKIKNKSATEIVNTTYGVAKLQIASQKLKWYGNTQNIHKEKHITDSATYQTEEYFRRLQVSFPQIKKWNDISNVFFKLVSDPICQMPASVWGQTLEK